MASALMAFAYGLSAAAQDEKTLQPKQTDERDDDVVENGSDEAPEAPKQQTQPSSLADIAKAMVFATSNNAAAKPTTLLEFAKQQSAQAVGRAADAPSGATASPLLQVAQHEAALEQHASTREQLLVIANQVSKEDAETKKQESAMVERALQATSEQVGAEFLAKRQQEIADAVQQAIVEEQQHQQDEFEEEQDPAVQRAAAALTAKTQVAGSNENNANHKTKSSLTLSVDRHVLKQRQDRHGLQHSSKSMTKARTMKDKLSAFQCRELSITQCRVFLTTLTDNGSSANSKEKTCNMDAIHELAKDKAKLAKLKRNKKHEFAKLEDNRHCRFQPRFVTGGPYASKGNCKSNDSDDEGSGNQQRSEDFVRRMEAAERATSNCAAHARRKRTWHASTRKNARVSEIADQFLERMAEYLEQKKAAAKCRQNEMEQMATSSSRFRHQQHSGDNQNDENGERTWAEVQDAFLGRVQLDLMQRELTKETILKELQRECSFAPCISTKAKRLELGTFDERLRRDLENRHARQEQYKLLSGAIAAETNARVKQNSYNNKPKYHVPSSTFQERLGADLEKRRERDNNFNNLHTNQRTRPRHTQIKW
ncbi:hypothetical protein FI667_g10587, partial [Globisporangium splendens]